MALSKLTINNPGNIKIVPRRFTGEVIPSSDPIFKEFKDMKSGYAAMFSLLNRVYLTQGQNTIKKIVYKYAPPHAPDYNNSDAYVNSIVSQTGIAANEVISVSDESKFKALVMAMSKHENGVKANAGEVNDGWNLYAKEAGIKKIITGTIILFGASAFIAALLIIKSL